MKKIILLFSIAILFSITPMQAQFSRVFDNNFAGIGGGADLYFNEHNTLSEIFQNHQIGYPSIDVYYGKWMINSVAFRIGLNTFVAENRYQTSGQLIGAKSDVSPHTGNIGDSTGMASSKYTTVNIAFMWDVLTSISGVKTDRSFNVYPMAGAGAVIRSANEYTQYSDSDFTLFAGINFDFKLYRDFFLYLEPKLFFFPADYDGNEKSSHVFDLTLGLKYNIRSQEYRQRRAGESQTFSDDWYLAVGAGANYSLKGAAAGGPGALGEITLGKYLTTCASMRLQANAGMLSANSGSATYLGLHADAMFDVLNIWQQYISGYNAKLGRGFSPMLYVGAGAYDRLDVSKIHFGADAGCMFRFYFDKKSDLYLDLRMAMTPHLVFPSATFGYIRNLGLHSCR